MRLDELYGYVPRIQRMRCLWNNPDKFVATTATGHQLEVEEAARMTLSNNNFMELLRAPLEYWSSPDPVVCYDLHPDAERVILYSLTQ